MQCHRNPRNPFPQVYLVKASGTRHSERYDADMVLIVVGPSPPLRSALSGACPGHDCLWSSDDKIAPVSYGLQSATNTLGESPCALTFALKPSTWLAPHTKRTGQQSKAKISPSQYFSLRSCEAWIFLFISLSE
jgi:hypothetical protein